MIGSHEVAVAAPDGYTFVISGIASHVIAPAFSRNPPYDGLRDFTHVAYLGGPPVVLVVHSSLGVHSFKEFLDLAKRTPEGLNYVSSGVGTHGFLFAEDMARREHFKLIQVPYKGSNPAVLDLIAGHVKIGAMAWSSAVEQIRAGSLRALGSHRKTGWRVSRRADLPGAQLSDRSVPQFSLSGPEAAGRSANAQCRGDRGRSAARRAETVAGRHRANHFRPRTSPIRGSDRRWAPVAKAMARSTAIDCWTERENAH